MNNIRSSFTYLEKDFFGNHRIFFENSGGSLRLEEVCKTSNEIHKIPDCPRRSHDASKFIGEIIDKGKEDIKNFFNFKNGTILTHLTASSLMFEIMQKIASTAEGKNIVTTPIEHPAAFDACKLASKKYNLTLRVSKANKKTGGVDTESLYEKVDENTSIVSIIAASNITGAKNDIINIVKKIREINPEVYIVVDAVQAAAHSLIDVEAWDVDVVCIAPYKMFGNRGVAFAFVSERLIEIPHNRLLDSENDNWELGSPVPAHYAEFSEIVKYICLIGSNFIESNKKRDLIEEGMKRIHSHEQAMLSIFIKGTKNVEGLKSIKNLKLHFAEENQENHELILPISFTNIDTIKAMEMYKDNNIIVFNREYDSYYSHRILNALDLNSIIRVSPLHCHNINEIEGFLQVTKKIAKT